MKKRKGEWGKKIGNNLVFHFKLANIYKWQLANENFPHTFFLFFIFFALRKWFSIAMRFALKLQIELGPSLSFISVFLSLSFIQCHFGYPGFLVFYFCMKRHLNYTSLYFSHFIFFFYLISGYTRITFPHALKGLLLQLQSEINTNKFKQKKTEIKYKNIVEKTIKTIFSFLTI